MCFLKHFILTDLLIMEKMNENGPIHSRISTFVKVPTHIWVSGVFGPAIDGHHDPLACQRRCLTRFDSNARDSAVRRSEEMSG